MKRAVRTMDDWLIKKKGKVGAMDEESSGRWDSLANHMLVYTTENSAPNPKIAAFDFDGTLIVTKTGMSFPQNEHDWQFFNSLVMERLHEIAETHKIVIFTNQRGIQKGIVQADSFKRKIEKICQTIDLPMQVFVSLGTLQYRKPYIGMWEYLERHCNNDVPVDREHSFYVGDAAGRPAGGERKKRDHSCVDRLFAMNIGIVFHTPESYFVKGPSFECFSLPFFSSSKLLDEKRSLYDPESTKVPGNQPEMLIFVGYPGCGKSHLAKKLAAEHGYGIVNRDTQKTWQKCVGNAKIILKRKQSVIVDNTNIDAESRGRYITVAKAFNVDTRCFWFNCGIDQASHNCKYRIIIGTDKEHKEIGQMVLNKYRAALQQPTLQEGFSSIVRVNFVPDFDNPEHERIYRMYLNDS